MNSAFQKKLFRTISLLVAVLVLVFFSVVLYSLYSNMRRDSQRNLDMLATRTSAELQSLLGNMDELALYVSTNPTVTQTFRAASQREMSNLELSSELMGALTSITIPSGALSYRISLYNSLGNHVALGPPVNNLDERLAADTLAEWYAALPIEPNGASYQPLKADEWSDSGTQYITLYREIYDPNFIGVSRGITEIQCPYRIVDGILAFESSEYTCFLYGNETGVFYASAPDAVADANGLLAEYQTPSSKATNTYEGLIYTGVELDNGWTLVLTQTQDHIYTVLLPVVGLSVLVLALVLATALVVLFAITRQTTEPLRKLTSSIENISVQNPALETDLSGYSDEFAGLQYAFDTMMDRLLFSMEENVQHKAYEMRANMLALQSQMDPHFLYNVLAIIKVMGKEGNTAQITKTCDYLASMMRYISGYDDSMVSLEQELEHCRNYLKLMKLRYEDNLQYTIEVEEGLESWLHIIPKLSLQPLVENCFKHAFKKSLPPWRVDIRAGAKGERWFLSVTDNGFSITEEAIAELEDKLAEFLLAPSDVVASLHIGGMGLLNTIARLKLTYKEDIVYEIRPLEGGGTTVVLEGTLHAAHTVG